MPPLSMYFARNIDRNNDKQVSMMPRIFISHAVKDKPIVDEFFDLLQTGINVSPNETFCSSLEGMGIPGGTIFVDYIKGQIQEPDLILLMLSPRYLDSAFCLCELGAGWAMSHNMLPLVIPPLEFSSLQGVLTGINAYMIDSAPKLTEFRDRVIELLGLDAPPASRWEVKRDKFLKALPRLLKKLPQPTTVTLEEHKALEAKCEELLAEADATAEEISTLKEKVKRLEKCKDKDEVREVLREFTDDWSQFQSLCNRARTLSDKLPSVAVEAIYHDVTEKEGRPRGDELWDNIRSAVQEDYLIDSGDNVEVNYKDPSVGEYSDAVDEVRSFLVRQEEESAFIKQYIDEYKHRPDFKSRRLWEEHLGLNSFSRW